MNCPLITIGLTSYNCENTIKNAIEKFKESSCSEAYYVGNKNKLLGKISP